MFALIADRNKYFKKMSKSKPETLVEPVDMIKKYGADSLRWFLVSSSSADSNFNWNDDGMPGSFNFVKRVYDYFSNFKPGKTNKIIANKFNQTIKQVTEDVEGFKHNLAVIKIRKLFDDFVEEEIDKKTSVYEK